MLLITISGTSEEAVIRLAQGAHDALPWAGTWRRINYDDADFLRLSLARILVLFNRKSSWQLAVFIQHYWCFLFPSASSSPLLCPLSSPLGQSENDSVGRELAFWSLVLRRRVTTEGKGLCKAKVVLLRDASPSFTSSSSGSIALLYACDEIQWELSTLHLAQFNPQARSEIVPSSWCDSTTPSSAFHFAISNETEGKKANSSPLAE